MQNKCIYICFPICKNPVQVWNLLVSSPSFKSKSKLFKSAWLNQFTFLHFCKNVTMECYLGLHIYYVIEWWQGTRCTLLWWFKGESCGWQITQQYNHRGFESCSSTWPIEGIGSSLLLIGCALKEWIAPPKATAHSLFHLLRYI